MTVGELIDVLKKYPEDMKVEVDGGEGIHIYSYVENGGYIRISGSEYSGWGW